jgi:glycerol kinase
LFGAGAESARLAASGAATAGVYLVPAFTGLGAPYWDERARGLLIGITRGTTREHIVRATLEAIAYQTRDIVEALESDSKIDLDVLRVDGGAAANDFLMQFQADVLGTVVERPALLEVTAFGAAALAGLAVGFWEDVSALPGGGRAVTRFEPRMSADRRDALYAGWRRAVERSRGWADA